MQMVETLYMDFSDSHQGLPQAVYTWGGGQVQGDKALVGGTHEGRRRPYGGDLTLIDYIIN